MLGDEDFLVERATSSVVAAVRERAGGTEIPVTRVRAGEVTEAQLIELLSPSLFADERIVVVTDADEAGKEPAALIADVAGSIPEGITLVVAHSGGGRAKSMVAALKKVGAEVHDCASISRSSDRIAFVRNEFRSHGVRVGHDVSDRLIESIGSDLRELAAAAAQLVSDTAGKVDVAAVDRYYSGRPEVTGFEIADLAVGGDRAAALESLAWAAHHGVAHVLLADALAEAVHGIARARGIGRLDQYAAASELGMPPWRAKKVLGQAAGWNRESVAAALQVVATLNGEVKGQAADADFALQRAVGAVADLRPTRR
ncbi:DNA polymerase III subunit delta [Williamsia sterculiae]|uniref:DNA polymerase III subunit delta n=1 Tax=Williamsia sterculiae TaxID=1344003 RepID=UPI001F178DC7|nr:DNA polymerase III subunit delta [Williamsia sterculiae]